MGSVESPFEAGKNEAMVTFTCPVLWLPLAGTEKAGNNSSF